MSSSLPLIYIALCVKTTKTSIITLIFEHFAFIFWTRPLTINHPKHEYCYCIHIPSLNCRKRFIICKCVPYIQFVDLWPQDDLLVTYGNNHPMTSGWSQHDLMVTSGWPCDGLLVTSRKGHHPHRGQGQVAYLVIVSFHSLLFHAVSPRRIPRTSGWRNSSAEMWERGKTGKLIIFNNLHFLLINKWLMFEHYK